MTDQIIFIDPAETFEDSFGAPNDIEFKGDGFVIEDDDVAEWALRKIANIEAERDRIVGALQRKVEAFQRQIAMEVEKCNVSSSFFTSSLQEYMERQECKETKTQLSYRLPSGTLVSKKPETVFIHDDDAILFWCLEQAPEFVETEQTLKWGELKKTLGIIDIPGDENKPPERKAVNSETGEIIPGITISEKPGSFSIRR